MRRIMTGQVPQSREFPIPGFFLGAGTGIGKIWFRKKCELPEISFFGVVPKKVSEPETRKIWYRK